MLKFAANLSMMFTEVPFMERFAKAAAAGFCGVEFHYLDDLDAKLIKEQLERHALTQVLFNLYPGDVQSGRHGIASIPGYEKDFRKSIAQGVEDAQLLGCSQVHILAGTRQPQLSEVLQRETFVRNLQFAADSFAPHGIKVLIEPINSYDKPGYFLTKQSEAEKLLQEIDRPNAAIQLDLYHCQIMEGDLMRTIQRLWGRFCHIQIASVPHRHEPNQGEINYPWLLKQIDTLGYIGWIGCEYYPHGITEEGLGWLRHWQP